MPKRTAVIDIGSNSARLVIYQRSSRYGFHLLTLRKSRVRIGEGAYENGGNLQKEGMQRAFGALLSFSHTIREYKVHKLFCIATSALRDAPNGHLFKAMVKRELGIEIKIIDGLKEAEYGAIAAANLLPFDSGITIDIGGGSTDMALVKKGEIVQRYSLDLGTVRLKELFTDKGRALGEAVDFISGALRELPESFKAETAISIGGTARALSRAIIAERNYPLDKLHAFSYSFRDYAPFMKRLTEASIKELDSFNIKKSRFDTIREGTLIFMELLGHIGAKRVLSSGVGVREGVFLKDLLRNDGYRFPPGINPSMRSILDRFDILGLPVGNRFSIARRLYDATARKYTFEKEYFPQLKDALKLCNIGKMLTIYKEHRHAFYIAMQELNFGYSHESMMLISFLLSSKGDSLYHKALYRKYKDILPKKESLKWLCFIYRLTLLIHENSTDAEVSFRWDGDSLEIHSDRALYLAREEIESMQRPESFDISLIDGWDEMPQLPENP